MEKLKGALVVGFLRLFALLPWRAVQAVGNAIGWLMWKLPNGSRDVVRINPVSYTHLDVYKRQAMDEYMTQSALEDASLHVNENAPGLSGGALEKLVGEYRGVMKTLDRLSRVYPKDITEHFVYLPRIGLEQLADHAGMQAWLERFSARLKVMEKSGQTYTASLREDRERHLWLPEVEVKAHGLSSYTTFNRDFFASNDYKTVTALGDQLNNLLEEGAYVQRGERKKPVSSFKEALEWLMNESTKRHSIQPVSYTHLVAHRGDRDTAEGH